MNHKLFSSTVDDKILNTIVFFSWHFATFTFQSTYSYKSKLQVQGTVYGPIHLFSVAVR